MRKTTKQILSYGSLIFGVLLVAAPFLVGRAQLNTKNPNTEDPKHKQQDSQTERAKVANSVAGSLVLDTITSKEPEWVLTKGGFVPMRDGYKSSYVSMKLKKNDSTLDIVILECASRKDADDQFDIPRQYGGSEPIEGYGERADRLVGQRGDLLAIRFRKGIYFVTVWSPDQKTAEAFASYVLQSLPTETKCR